jgi:hypothetical protein
VVEEDEGYSRQRGIFNRTKGEINQQQQEQQEQD